jgi:hypothetical protein
LWVSLHLNVPGDKDSPTAVIVRKVIWVVLALIAPEYVTVSALRQWQEARRGVRDAHEAGLKGWTTAHCFFANMGGIQLKSTERVERCDVHQIIWLAQSDKLPDELRNLSKERIEAHSKADSFVKAIACFQVLWLVAQSIARAIQGLPLTTLELSTLAFAAYALVNYCLWWNKPLDVADPLHLTIADSVLLDKAFVDSRGDRLGKYKDGRYSNNILTTEDIDRFFSTVPLPMSLWCMLFGGIHCAAWNFSFPSPIEQLMWRLTSVIATTSLPVLGIVYIVQGLTGRVMSAETRYSKRMRSMALAYRDLTSTNLFFFSTHGIILIMYIICRMYLLAEAVVSLRSLPPGCYETVAWSKFLPQIS